MHKILFVDTVHPILEKRLTVAGYVCEHDLSSSKKDIEAKIQDYFGLIIRSRFPIDEAFLDQCTALKFIARSGAGLENINLDAAKKRSITVFNSPEGNSDAVGEHALGMLLMLFNQLKKGDAEVRNALWDRSGNRGLEIAGKTIGLIGYGNMGNALSKKLAGFDCTVIAYDKYKTGFGNELVKEVGLSTIFETTDILSIHLPLSEETHHFVDTDFIAKFKKAIYLINTARGNNVCLADVVEALKGNQILGACLDVLEYEASSFETINRQDLPEDFKYLAASNNVILSPHVAGWTKESYVKLAQILADKIEKKFSL